MRAKISDRVRMFCIGYVSRSNEMEFQFGVVMYCKVNLPVVQNYKIGWVLKY